MRDFADCRMRPRGLKARSAAAPQRAVPRHGDLAWPRAKPWSFADVASIKHDSSDQGSPHHGPTLRGFVPHPSIPKDLQAVSGYLVSGGEL